MKYYGITDRGRLRRSNQDSYVIATDRVGDIFAMVCDGIGGGRGGDVASQMAVKHFSRAFSTQEGFKDLDEVRIFLRHEIDACNAEIYHAGQADASLKGMGTTLTGVLITSCGRMIVNMGDSRTYGYFKDGSFRQLTMDHSLLQDMINHGELTQEQIDNFPRKNVLTNALGVWEKARFDAQPFGEPVEGFLICSDGLHGYVDLNRIKQIVLDRSSDPGLRVRRLYQSAMDVGGFDNITAILIDLEGAETHEF